MRFVNNEDRIGLGNNINGFSAAEFIQFHINTAGISTFGIESLTIDDHTVYGTILSKVRNIRQLAGIVDKEPYLFPVFIIEMVLRDLERLIDPFSDGNAGNYNDKFAPSVKFIQLVNGFDIGVGFTDTRFHFDSEIDSGTDQRIGRLYLLIPLHFLNTGKHYFRSKITSQEFVGKTTFFKKFSLPIDGFAGINHIRVRSERLTGKNIANRPCCIRLKFLMFELEFHCLSLDLIKILHLT